MRSRLFLPFPHCEKHVTNPNQLWTLKQLLMDAKATNDDLQGVKNFFFQNFGNDPAFLAMGQPTTDKTVDGNLETFAHRVFNLDVDMANTPLVGIADFHFKHGPFTMNGKAGIVIYFEDVGRGLIAVAWPARSATYMPFSASGPFTGNGALGHADYLRGFNDNSASA
jgi:hypothetical protein